nr:hypothetical protein [Knoellia flava]
MSALVPHESTNDTAAGVTGAVGVTAVDATDAEEVPIALVAVTVNVYAVPLLSPMTVQDRAPVVVQVFPPGLEVTVYPVTEEPPLDVGADHATWA